MPQYQFTFAATATNSFAQPDFSVIASPPLIATDLIHSPTEAQLQEFVTQLNNWNTNFFASSDADIFSKLRDKVRSRIFGQNATNPLSNGNPIIDVYVNASRESGDGDMWRDPGSDTFAIHPMTNMLTNQVLNQGPINIGIAQHPNPPPTPSYWKFADVIAYKI